MDTFVCSSWYYLRFADPKNADVFVDAEKLKRWLPVDMYMGGAEHTVLHLLYARFFTKALRKYGYVEFDEPFMKLRHQGMVLAEDGRKMSKSLGNVVNPDDVVEYFGADALRLYEMFMGPLEDSKLWNTGSIVGQRRFLEKIWKLHSKVANDVAEEKSIQTILHKTVKKVTEDIESMCFNTAISSLMVLVNEMSQAEKISRQSFSALLLLASPFVPHITEELWESLGNSHSIFLQAWPKYDERYLCDESIEMVIQVNGKLRAKLQMLSGASREDIEKLAFQDEKVIAHTKDKTVRKIIFVQDKLMNIVVG
jgi:leucyl-tRNA synthetase